MKKGIYLILTIFVIACAGYGCGSDSGDSTIPTVASVTPINAATVVPVNTTVTVTFNKAMDTGTVTASSFTLATAAGPMGGTVSASADQKTFTFTPSANLTSLMVYTATVTTAVKDVVGHALAANYTWTFTTDIAGVLDTSFNSTGYAYGANVPGGSGVYYGKVIAADPSGNPYILGVAHLTAGDLDNVAIWKFLSTGVPDANFGANGVFTSVNDHNDDANDLLIDSNGNLDVALKVGSTSPTRLFEAVRITSAGALDPTFGSGGGYQYDAIEPSGASGIALDAAGNVFVTGYTNILSEGYMLLVKLSSVGVPDPAFTTYVSDIDQSEGDKVAIDSNGKIYVAGSSTGGAGSYVTLWRFNSDGSLDATFGSSGVATFISAGNGSVGDMKLDSAGRPVVAASIDLGAGMSEISIIRFDTNGAPDSTFGQNGLATRNNIVGGGGNEYLYGLDIDSSGRIIVSGYGVRVASSGLVSGFVLRYSSAGVADTTFGTNGVAMITNMCNMPDAAMASDAVFGSTLDPSDKILITGSCIEGTAMKMFVARLK